MHLPWVDLTYFCVHGSLSIGDFPNGEMVSLQARAVRYNEYLFLYRTSLGVDLTFEAPLMAPASVHRSTGTFRDPNALFDLPADVIRLLSEAENSAGGGRTIGLVVHTVSRHAAAVGVFASAAACRSWWRQPFNRLHSDSDVLWVMASVEGSI
jgi:hypothetical protein